MQARLGQLLVAERQELDPDEADRAGGLAVLSFQFRELNDPVAGPGDPFQPLLARLGHVIRP